MPSAAGLALKAGVSANQLCKWIVLERRRPVSIDSVELPWTSAAGFVPVMKVADPFVVPVNSRRPASATVAPYPEHDRWHCVRAARVPNAQTYPRSRLGKTYQCLWPRRHDGVYQRFRSLNLAIQSNAPSALTLAEEPRSHDLSMACAGLHCRGG